VWHLLSGWGVREGRVEGLATAAFLLFYQWVIEPAGPHSLRVKAWSQLTNVSGLEEGGGGG
jgi:hypothetical protein